MTFTLTALLVGGVALAVILALASRPHENTAGRTAATDATGRADWHVLTVSALRDAEELLDYLEAQGATERELVVLGKSRFAVRWR